MTTKISSDVAIESADRIDALGAVVLCGGKSSRMGVSKSLLWFDGDTFLQRVIKRVSQVAGPVVCVTAHGEADEMELPSSVIVVGDERSELGPLEGIRVGLQALSKHATHAFVTSCDVPLLKPELIRLLAQQRAQYQAIMPVQAERVYGMTAIYQTNLHSSIPQLMTQGSRRVSGLKTVARTLEVPVEQLRIVDPQLDSLMNINSPDEYFALLAKCGLVCPENLRMKLLDTNR